MQSLLVPRGGFSETRPATPEIQMIADKVKPQLEEKTNQKYETFEAVEYRSQVVAGTNYIIKVDVGNGSFTHLKVFEGILDRKDELELTGYQTNKTKDNELTSF